MPYHDFFSLAKKDLTKEEKLVMTYHDSCTNVRGETDWATAAYFLGSDTTSVTTTYYSVLSKVASTHGFTRADITWKVDKLVVYVPEEGVYRPKPSSDAKSLSDEAADPMSKAERGAKRTLKMVIESFEEKESKEGTGVGGRTYVAW